MLCGTQQGQQWGCQVQGNVTDRWQTDSKMQVHWDTEPNQPKRPSGAVAWGLGWDSGRAAVCLVGFLAHPALAKPKKVLSPVQGNSATGADLHETFRLALSPPNPGVPPAQTDSPPIPAARGQASSRGGLAAPRCKSCYSKVLVGVIREQQGLALWRNQPRTATDGPLAFLATGGTVLVKFQFQ